MIAPLSLLLLHLPGYARGPRASEGRVAAGRGGPPVRGGMRVQAQYGGDGERIFVVTMSVDDARALCADLPAGSPLRVQLDPLMEPVGEEEEGGGPEAGG